MIIGSSLEAMQFRLEQTQAGNPQIQRQVFGLERFCPGPLIYWLMGEQNQESKKFNVDIGGQEERTRSSVWL